MHVEGLPLSRNHKQAKDFRELHRFGIRESRFAKIAYPWVQQLLCRHQGDAAVPVKEIELVGLALDLANVRSEAKLSDVSEEILMYGGFHI